MAMTSNPAPGPGSGFWAGRFYRHLTDVGTAISHLPMSPRAPFATCFLLPHGVFDTCGSLNEGGFDGG
jgi:hypothetical protein